MDSLCEWEWAVPLSDQPLSKAGTHTKASKQRRPSLSLSLLLSLSRSGFVIPLQTVLSRVAVSQRLLCTMM